MSITSTLKTTTTTSYNARIISLRFHLKPPLIDSCVVHPYHTTKSLSPHTATQPHQRVSRRTITRNHVQLPVGSCQDHSLFRWAEGHTHELRLKGCWGKSAKSVLDFKSKSQNCPFTPLLVVFIAGVHQFSENLPTPGGVWNWFCLHLVTVPRGR